MFLEHLKHYEYKKILKDELKLAPGDRRCQVLGRDYRTLDQRNLSETEIQKLLIWDGLAHGRKRDFNISLNINEIDNKFKKG